MQLIRNLTSFAIFILCCFNPLFGQAKDSASDFYMIALLIVVGALILVSAILMLSENLIQIEAKKSGIDPQKTAVSLFPSFNKLFAKPTPSYTNGDRVFELSQGFDILLNGEAEKETSEINVKRFAIRPTDFRGIAPIPKVVVEEGDNVKAGDVLFHDKKDETIKYVSPVSGEVVEIKRGEKRAITEIIILADKEIKFHQFDPPSIKESKREEIVHYLCQSGGWTFINERPFDVLPDPSNIPSNIFISTFDSAPLAPDSNYIVRGKEELFQKGLDTLNRLTGGKVHLGLNAGAESPPHEAFTSAKGVEIHWFRGKHPAGNVGVQIHHIAPIKPGTKVWTLGVQEVISLGELMFKGRFNASRLVALTGSGVTAPHYIKTYLGANVGDLTQGKLAKGKLRIISGDVLSGTKLGEQDFLDYRSDQITIIREGDYFEMFGWLLPISPRPSVSKTYPNFLFPDLKFDGDTNNHGERRAFVVTGQYEQLLPMKIYPQHLLKAVITGDFEEMEGLGIYELTEEDLALCEFACTSKMPLQNILREGLEMMREQG